MKNPTMEEYVKSAQPRGGVSATARNENALPVRTGPLEQPAQVQMHLDALFNVVAKLSDRIRLLEERLLPVLTPEEPECKPANAPGDSHPALNHLSPLAANLRGLAGELDARASRVENLISRLET